METLDLDTAIDEMYRVLKPHMSEGERYWVEEGVKVGEPYSSFLMLVSYAVKFEPHLARKYFPLLEEEDSEEYENKLVENERKLSRGH